MILGFKKEFPWGKFTNFELRIKGEIKIHTFRSGNRWNPGNIIHFATGVRTKFYHQFTLGQCINTQEIEIKYEKKLECPAIYIDGKRYAKDRFDPKYELLVKNDGFDDVHEFLRWFDKDFKGQIIHWTDFRY